MHTPTKEPKTLPEVIRNDSGLYEGNLIHYFQVLFNNAQNLRHPYHNFRHMLHVMWLCYDACRYYSAPHGPLSPRQMRNLLIAALFHDINHSGLMGEDDLNIERAVRELRKHVDGMDAEYLDTIIELVRATQYPYVTSSEQLDLCGKILRDADVSQALNTAWIQQVVFGLAAEWGKTPVEVLKSQGPFLRGLSFHTNWAQDRFPQEVIDAKAWEAQELLRILGIPKTAAA